jgi:2,2-dialkylglycine decarboxylase (pyruvate)
MKTIDRSLNLWKEHGEFVLMATSYRDEILSSGRGCRVFDVDGNSLLDLEAGQICAILGHGHPKLLKRLAEQMEKLAHCGTAFLSEPVFEGAKKMAGIAPGDLKKTVFLSTGAEANECAFRIAKVCTGKRGIVGFNRGYSGLTLATISAGISARDTCLAVPGTLKILTPDCDRCPVKATYPACDILCLKVSEEFLLDHVRDEIAAFIVEPILSAGGMIFPPTGYFVRLADTARRLGALLISDEAQTGMGRTGKWFGIEWDQVVPDILVFSKGAGGGFPASGVVVTEEIAQRVLGRFSNFSSHQTDPLAGAAVSSVIDIIEEEGLRERAAVLGSGILESLTEMRKAYPFVGKVRGKGLMIGVEMSDFKENAMSASQVGTVFESLCRRAGVHIKSIHGGRIFRILPPLTITEEEVEQFLGTFSKCLSAIAAGNWDERIIAPRNAHTRRFDEIAQDKTTFRRMAKKIWQSSPERLVGKILPGRKPKP